GRPAVVAGVEQLARELFGHAALGPPPRRADHPPHRERRATIGTDLYGHLVRGAPDTARLHLDGGLHVVDRGLEHLERILLAPVFHRLEGVVHDALGGRLLPPDHHDVHELRHQPAPVLRVRSHLTLSRTRPAHPMLRRPWWPSRRTYLGGGLRPPS